ncbi:MAG: hypothetical protein DHS20C21_18170 [Gemmatimonadota bacterium]|nr:MAG: hypothetical protein DHS20C21_18170 [Gemmatimonadota bacterium]
MPSDRGVNRRLSWVITVLLLTPLVILAYSGRFVRYAADDFSTAEVAGRMNAVEAMFHWYTSWSGRFSFSFTMTLLERFGASTVQVLPAFFITAWISSLAWGLSPLWDRAAAGARGTALQAAIVIVHCAVFSVRELEQVFLWQTGMVTYVAPLVLLPVAVRLATDGREGPARNLAMIGAAILVFIAGGFSETYAAAQVVLCSALLGVSLLRRTTALPSKVWGVLLASATVSLLLIAAAPGNRVRSSLLAPGPALPELVMMTTLYTAKLIARFVVSSWAQVVVALLFALVMAESTRVCMRVAEVRRRHIAGGVALTLLLVAACVAPSAYGLSGPPPGRALIIPYAALLFCVLLAGFIGACTTGAGRPSARGRAKSVLVGGLLLVAAGSCWFESTVGLSRLAGLETYANAWDQRDRLLAGSDREDVTIRWMRSPFGLEEVGPDPDHWVNRAVANYYGLRTVMATPLVGDSGPPEP